MLGIKYVIENKLQNNRNYNNNTRFTLENLLGKNQPMERNQGPLKPCALNHLHPCSFPSQC